MEHFVEKESIVRKIWGKADTILFVFAGASAEFALNKAVDWLYFTGKLPLDPLGRLFSTVKYARQIVFSSKEDAYRAIDILKSIHTKVELKREASIPDWAYLDVLFMLIYYSIAAHELLERKLNDLEKEEVFTVFYRVGYRMGLKKLPPGYTEWLTIRKEYLEQDLQVSDYTYNLCHQYKKSLGFIRYTLLKEVQILMVPQEVIRLLRLRKFSLLKPFIPIYKFICKLKLDPLIKSMLLPSAYKAQIEALDTVV